MSDSVVRDSTELLVTGPDAGVLRLGLLLPLSGPLGLTGPSGLSAARLAAIEVNAAGGAAGRAVELVPVDAGHGRTRWPPKPVSHRRRSRPGVRRVPYE